MELTRTGICTLVAFVALLFYNTNTSAQIFGCTYSLSTNYNPLATSNDGSCLYANSNVSATSSNILSTTLEETSGLVLWNNMLWTHNDNTDLNIYAIDTIDGTLIQSYIMVGITNTDWEEIAEDSLYIYIGDFGNNANGNRVDLKIFRVDKNSILLNSPVIDIINFTYSNQTNFTPTGSNNTDFDCEAFEVTTDSIFLFTKQWVSNQTSVYSLSKIPGSHIAQLNATYNVQGLITGSTSLADQNLTVLCGYNNFLSPFVYLLYDYTGSEFFSANKRKINISLPFHQVEGITTNNGTKYYISNELFVQPPIINNAQKLHEINLAPFLDHYLNGLVLTLEEPDLHYKFKLFPNPTSSTLNIEIPVTYVRKSFSIINQIGVVVRSGTLETQKYSLDIKDLPGGIYVFQAGFDSRIIFAVINN